MSKENRIAEQIHLAAVYHPRVLFDGSEQAGAEARAEGRQTWVVRGRKSILAMGPALRELARRCGQTGEADQLEHFLLTPNALKKEPWLVLMKGEKAELEAAVLLFEFKSLFGLGTRVFASADGSGRRNVLAPAEARARVAGLAVRVLLEHGAQMVHLSFDEKFTDERVPCQCEEIMESRGLKLGHAERALAGALGRTAEGKALDGRARKLGGGWRWALLEHELPLYLKLEPTYEATLARIGQKTRFNLRYYRRRSEHDLGCHFVAEPAVSLADFLAFNRRCTFAVEDEVVRRRFATLGPGAFLSGIKDGQGAWLSLVGGRKQHGMVEIDWQMNRADLPQYSLSTVMRAYLLEYEIGLGARRLYIEGSTAHPIVRSFVKGPVMELTVKRDSVYAWFLERFASVVFPPKNYLAQTLGKSDLVWRTVRGSKR